MIRKFGILYLCTGKYKIFWDGFYNSAQKYLFAGNKIEKSYFVFTDATHLDYESNENVHKIFQQRLPWPYITLNRFGIFQKALPQLEEMDYVFFFNANMLLIDDVGEEILPTVEKPFSFLLHPGMINKKRSEFTYETNPRSLAYISDKEGIHYYQGCLNGGMAYSYLAMIGELSNRIDQDLKNGVIAIWHDESHLNRYALENQHLINNLSPIYGWPEGWNTSISPKILSLDKRILGGHAYMRSNKNRYTYKFELIFRKFRKKIFNRLRTINFTFYCK